MMASWWLHLQVIKLALIETGTFVTCLYSKKQKIYRVLIVAIILLEMDGIINGARITDVDMLFEFKYLRVIE